MSGNKAEAKGTGARRPARFESDDERWAAVVNRDRRADGRFFFSVTTTGIYCRPGCAARRPRRENVRFYASPEEAERAGYRPCRRCRPNAPSLAERRAAAVAGALPPHRSGRGGAGPRRTGAGGRHEPLPFPSRLQGRDRDHAEGLRGGMPRGPARNALREGARVTDAIYDAGFASSSRFYAASTDLLGMAPASFRRGGQAETIRFALRECSLGWVLVAATGKGVCAIQLGDDPGALVRDLTERLFPNAECVGADEGFEGLVARVVALVEAPALGTRAAARRARHRVSAAGVAGAARHSGRLDRKLCRDRGPRIGAPSAARAVAQACGGKSGCGRGPVPPGRAP